MVAADDDEDDGVVACDDARCGTDGWMSGEWWCGDDIICAWLHFFWRLCRLCEKKIITFLWFLVICSLFSFFSCASSSVHSISRFFFLHTLTPFDSIPFNDFYIASLFVRTTICKRWFIYFSHCVQCGRVHTHTASHAHIWIYQAMHAVIIVTKHCTEKSFPCEQERMKVEKWNSPPERRPILRDAWNVYTVSSEEKHSWMNWTRFEFNRCTTLTKEDFPLNLGESERNSWIMLFPSGFWIKTSILSTTTNADASPVIYPCIKCFISVFLLLLFLLCSPHQKKNCYFTVDWLHVCMKRKIII